MRDSSCDPKIPNLDENINKDANYLSNYLTHAADLNSCKEAFAAGHIHHGETNHPVDFLIDTGALSYSLIDLGTLQKLKDPPVIKPYHSEIFSGTRNAFQIVGCVKIHCSFGKDLQYKFPITFIVIKDLAVRAIISNLACQEVDMIIKPSQRWISIDNRKYQLTNGYTAPCIMMATYNYTLKPKASKLIKIRRADGNTVQGQGDWTLTPVAEFKNSSCDQLARRDTHESLYFMVTNRDTTATLDIRKNTPVCILEKLSLETELVRPDSTSKEDIYQAAEKVWSTHMSKKAHKNEPDTRNVKQPRKKERRKSKNPNFQYLWKVKMIICQTQTSLKSI